MPGNPLVPQGVLNRARGSVVWAANPGLNVTAPFLGEVGISMTLGGSPTNAIRTMTGAVLSPELVQIASVRIGLLKTQALAGVYKNQIEVNSALADNITLYTDAPGGGIDLYNLVNCGLGELEALTFNGTDAGWVINVAGFYIINNSLFSS